jgi:Putative adhesin
MRISTKLMATVLALSAAPLALADTTFDKEVSAEERGVVEVSNTSGLVEVSGWDRHEVSVHGDLDEGVERVDVTSEPGRTLIKVVLPGHSVHRGEARLHIKVPRDSELHLTTVSADATVSGVNGAQRVNAVSGDVTTEIAAGNLELKTVSGDVKIKGHGQPAQLRVTTVSGDVHLEHGAGDLETTTVSGTLVVSLDTARSVHARTTSGDMHFETRLARGASFEASTVSGDLNVRASAEGGYAYEISTFSGDISDCFGGPKAEKGIVGHSMSGTRGEGSGHMRLKTMSGDVQLCDRS